MAFRLIPRDEKFFDGFVEMAGEIKGGAVLVSEILEPERLVWEKAQAIPPRSDGSRNPAALVSAARSA